MMNINESNRLISVSACKVRPECTESWDEWECKIHNPWLINAGGLREIDRYEIVRDNPKYHGSITIQHWENFEQIYESRKMQYKTPVESMGMFSLLGVEETFSAVYQLLANFHTHPYLEEKSIGISSGRAPLIHIEAFNPCSEEERYYRWFIKYGFNVYTPLLMNIDGLHEYALYQLIDSHNSLMPIAKCQQYPMFLNVYTFDDIQGYENYESNLGLAYFHNFIRTNFIRDLDFSWHVQYRFVLSWRK